MSTRIEKQIMVNVPVSVAYNQWTQFEEFPHFMNGVKKVEQLSDDRLRIRANQGHSRRVRVDLDLPAAVGERGAETMRVASQP